MKPSMLTDWITAASTGLTAIFTLLLGWVAIRSYNRDTKKTMPLIETTLRWASPPGQAAYIQLNLQIINRLDETMTVHRIVVRLPKKSTIAKAGTRTERLYGPLNKSKVLVFNKEIQAIGAEDSSQATMLLTGRPRRADIARFECHVFPREGWLSGWVRVDVSISTKAETIRLKRITVKRRMPAQDASSPLDTANKAD